MMRGEVSRAAELLRRGMSVDAAAPPLPVESAEARHAASDRRSRPPSVITVAIYVSSVEGEVSRE